MARIRTFSQRRLARLRRRRTRELTFSAPLRSSVPFRYDAALSLRGVGHRHAELAERTGLEPSIVHRKGEAHRSVRSKVWEQDLWLLRSPLGERASLDEHLRWLWLAVEPHQDLFRELVAEAESADVMLGCLSESIYPVLFAGPDALQIVRELKVGLAFNFTCV